MGTINTFGQVVGVPSPLLGFVGTESRTGAGDPLISTRLANLNNAQPIPFGSMVVMLPDSTGGTVRSYAEWVAGGSLPANAIVMGFAVREVKTMLVFNPTAGGVPVGGFIGSYQPGMYVSILLRGSITVQCNVGTPQAGLPVYLRHAVNALIPAGVIGGIEAAADSTNTVAINTVANVSNAYFKNGVLDANRLVEVVFLSRMAA